MTTDSQRHVAAEFGFELPVISLASTKQYFKTAADFIDYLEQHEKELKNEVKEKEAMAAKARLEIESRKEEKEELCDKLETICSLREETEMLYYTSRCLLCVERLRDIVVLPCFHFCLCTMCAKRTQICPRRDCKTMIMEVIHVFLV